MGNLKEIRTRISSVKSTRQITSAMKMVSAAKLKRAQDTAINIRPYGHKLMEILADLVVSLEGEIQSDYITERTVKRVLLVPISGNKGLCGNFNANIGKEVSSLVNERFQQVQKEGNLDFFCFGHKGVQTLRSRGYSIVADHSDMLEQLSFDQVSPIIGGIMEQFLKQEYDEVWLIYNRFKNAAVQLPTVEQFLPIQLTVDEEEFHPIHYLYEPSQHEIVQQLIPRALKIQFYEALAESLAAEHGARMTAMHKATDNATGLIRSLQLDYNKARQAAITREISEIVGGAEALSK
ncbi:MAG: ATP synthase F1 subunit gamma [Bacteroidales bacterium]